MKLNRIIFAIFVLICAVFLFAGCNDKQESFEQESCKHKWEKQAGGGEYKCSLCKKAHLCNNPEEWEKIENLNESTAVYKCRVCGFEHLTEKPDSTDKTENMIEGMKAIRIWDCHHPDDSERSPDFSVTFASIPNVEFKRVGTDGSIYLNDELLIGGPGYGCMSFYKAELAGTNKTVLCFGMSFGSGIWDERIVFIDCQTKAEIFTLNNRANHDYQLFVREGILCVRELKYGDHGVTRTGVFCDSGTEIYIKWDAKINLNEDINETQDGSPFN